MDPVSEGQVAPDVAPDVEAIAVGESTVVPVGRPVEQHHDAALGDALAVELHVPRVT